MDILLLCAREDLRRGYEAVLELYGHKVFTAPRLGCSYGVVISDLGDDTAYAAKELQGVSYDKVVLLVSPVWEGGELPLNTSAILRKPVTANKLLSALIGDIS